MKDRVLMFYPQSELPFLPPLEDFMRLAGLDGGLTAAIQHIAKQTNKVAPDAKTLRNAKRRTITRSTGNRIRDIVQLRMPDTSVFKSLEQRFRQNPAKLRPTATGSLL